MENNFIIVCRLLGQFKEHRQTHELCRCCLLLKKHHSPSFLPVFRSHNSGVTFSMKLPCVKTLVLNAEQEQQLVTQKTGKKTPALQSQPVLTAGWLSHVLSPPGWGLLISRTRLSPHKAVILRIAWCTYRDQQTPALFSAHLIGFTVSFHTNQHLSL